MRREAPSAHVGGPGSLQKGLPKQPPVPEREVRFVPRTTQARTRARNHPFLSEGAVLGNRSRCVAGDGSTGHCSVMKRIPHAVPFLAVALGAAFALQCGSKQEEAPIFPSSPADASPGTTTDVTVTPSFGGEAGTTFSDFPSKPELDPTLPTDIDRQFEAAATSGTDASTSPAPCVTEPQDDAMVPRNWTPLFVEWSSPAAQAVTEIRMTVDNQANPYVVYVPGRTFTMRAPLWAALALHSAGRDVVLSVRTAEIKEGKVVGRPSTPTRSTLHIAPVEAPGSVVYWSSSPATSFKGFTIGDTASKTVLTPMTAGTTSTGGKTECISCHTASVDGKLIFYTRDVKDVSRSIDVRQVASPVPPAAGDVSPAALALLGRNLQYAPQVSAAHYAPNDAVVVTVFRIGMTNQLIWTDLHAADANGWGTLARNGDLRQVSSPSWRHDGKAIAYTSSAAGGEGVIADVTPADATMDIYTVPYGNRLGGNATPLPGASDPTYREFYPTYSPSDTLLAFNRTKSPVSSYNQPSAELALVSGNGGTATRLRANDPAACSGKTSPGLTNSWPRWAPKVGSAGALRYYWLVFSSIRRAVTADRPQLYISAIVTRSEGATESVVAEYPAVYVTSQEPAGNNHIPAWDVFDVSTIPK